MKILVVLLVLAAFSGIIARSYAETQLHEGYWKSTQLGRTKGKHDLAGTSTDLGGKAIKGDGITANSFADTSGKGSQNLAVGYASGTGNSNLNGNPNSVSGGSNNNNNGDNSPYQTNGYDINSHHQITIDEYRKIIRNQPKRP